MPHHRDALCQLGVIGRPPVVRRVWCHQDVRGGPTDPAAVRLVERAVTTGCGGTATSSLWVLPVHAGNSAAATCSAFRPWRSHEEAQSLLGIRAAQRLLGELSTLFGVASRGAKRHSDASLWRIVHCFPRPRHKTTTTEPGASNLRPTPIRRNVMLGDAPAEWALGMFDPTIRCGLLQWCCEQSLRELKAIPAHCRW